MLATLPRRIYRNTHLTLLPGASFVRGAAETMLINGDGVQNLGGYTSHGTITIEGGVWDCQGIRLQQVQRFAISGNAIFSVDGTAVSMENADNGAVTGNQVSTPGAHGITAVICTHTSLTGDQVRYPGGNAVPAQDGNNVHIRDSYIKSPGRSAINTYYGFRLSSTASSSSLTGNNVRPNGSGNEAINGFSATNTCSLIARYGND